MSKLVKVHLYSQSEPVIIEDCRTTYQKGDLFCVMKNDKRTVYKFPLQHIFRIIEVDQEVVSESEPPRDVLKLLKNM